jgi:hypothetical protein
VGKYMEKIIEIKVENLSSTSNCEYYSQGKMWDSCVQINAKFQAGKSYGIIGDFRTGGWALSYALCGKEKPDKGEIKVNNITVDNEYLKIISCYVGEHTKNKFNILNRMPVNRIIEEGLKHNRRIEKSTEDIRNLFNISKERFNRKIIYMSHEFWKASMAIGYVWGKSLFCFPWLNNEELRRFLPVFKPGIDFLKSEGAIIIIPTSSHDNLNPIIEVDIKIVGLFSVIQRNEEAGLIDKNKPLDEEKC